MRQQQFFSILALPAAALGLPTTLVEPKAEAQTCNFFKYPDPPQNGGACWAWSAPTDKPSDYCGTITFETVTDINGPADWTKDCTALKEAELQTTRNILLATFLTDQFNTLLSYGKCAFQVKPKPRSSESDHDPIYFGTKDTTEFLQSSVEKSQGGSVGVKGTTTCDSYPLEWRVVPN